MHSGRAFKYFYFGFTSSQPQAFNLLQMSLMIFVVLRRYFTHAHHMFPYSWASGAYLFYRAFLFLSDITVSLVSFQTVTDLGFATDLLDSLWILCLIQSGKNIYLPPATPPLLVNSTLPLGTESGVWSTFQIVPLENWYHHFSWEGDFLLSLSPSWPCPIYFWAKNRWELR